MPPQTDQNVRVMVHFMAAGQPLDQEFARTATIGQVKTAALDKFHLNEGTNEEGNTVTYTLFDKAKKTPLENLATTVGAVAGDQKVLQLNLSQQITQG